MTLGAHARELSALARTDLVAAFRAIDHRALAWAGLSVPAGTGLAVDGAVPHHPEAGPLRGGVVVAEGEALVWWAPCPAGHPTPVLGRGARVAQQGGVPGAEAWWVRVHAERELGADPLVLGARVLPARLLLRAVWALEAWAPVSLATLVRARVERDPGLAGTLAAHMAEVASLRALVDRATAALDDAAVSGPLLATQAGWKACSLAPHLAAVGQPLGALPDPGLLDRAAAAAACLAGLGCAPPLARSLAQAQGRLLAGLELELELR